MNRSGFVQANIDISELAELRAKLQRLEAVEKAARRLVRLRTKRGLEVGSRMHEAVKALDAALAALAALPEEEG